MLVSFVSAAPFSGAFRRWVCAHVSSVLNRAEWAAQNLVVAQAALLAGRRGLRVSLASLFETAGNRSGDAALTDDDLPSPAALRGRLKALHAVLSDLPKYGLRLLQRVVGKSSESAEPRGFDQDDGLHRGLFAWRLAADPIERPPDKTAVLLML